MWLAAGNWRKSPLHIYLYISIESVYDGGGGAGGGDDDDNGDDNGGGGGGRSGSGSRSECCFGFISATIWVLRSKETFVT